MEFDSAQTMWRYETQPLTQPLFDKIKERYSKAGYKLPKLIFWNVNSRTKTIPLTENELGVVLMSGFSQNVLKMVMSDKYDPYEVLIEILDGSRYDQIKIQSRGVMAIIVGFGPADLGSTPGETTKPFP